jgi:hypothetical protein
VKRYSTTLDDGVTTVNVAVPPAPVTSLGVYVTRRAMRLLRRAATAVSPGHNTAPVHKRVYTSSGVVVDFGGVVYRSRGRNRTGSPDEQVMTAAPLR